MTYSEPLGIILLGGSKERIERVVSGEDKASEVGEELASKVEDDEEEVESNEADGGIGLGNTGGLLEVVEGRVLGQLLRPVSYAKPNNAVAGVSAFWLRFYEPPYRAGRCTAGRGPEGKTFCVFGAVIRSIDLELAVVFWCQRDAKSKFRGNPRRNWRGS